MIVELGQGLGIHPCFAQGNDLTDHDLIEQGGHVLSTPLRLDADDRFTGRGITVAFLDSGFYPHPDLTTPVNRILAYHNIAEKDGDHTELDKPNVASWHGMMTSVVAAGNGSLSNGFYRGIAPEAHVVLIKLAKTGRVSEKNIQDGLDWVLAHREEYGREEAVDPMATSDPESPDGRCAHGDGSGVQKYFSTIHAGCHSSGFRT